MCVCVCVLSCVNKGTKQGFGSETPGCGNLGMETFLLCQKALEDLDSVCADVEAFQHWCELSCLQIKVMLSATERTYCSHNLCVTEPSDGAGSMRGAGSLEVLNHREYFMALARM